MAKVLSMIAAHKALVELMAILVGPVVAVVIGEWLRNRSYTNQQRDDHLRRIIHFGYQLSPYATTQDDILGALNEAKYWYFDNEKIKTQIFNVFDKMKAKENAQDAVVELLQSIAKETGKPLSREEVEKVFSRTVKGVDWK